MIPGSCRVCHNEVPDLTRNVWEHRIVTAKEPLTAPAVCKVCRRSLAPGTSRVGEERVSFISGPVNAIISEKLGVLCSRECVSEYIKGNIRALEQSMICRVCGTDLRWSARFLMWACQCTINNEIVLEKLPTAPTLEQPKPVAPAPVRITYPIERGVPIPKVGAEVP